MWKGWLIALAAVALSAGRAGAVESAPATDTPAAGKPAETRGVPAGKLPVTRAQMAVAIARALAGGDDKIPPPPVRPSYRDVPEEHWAYRYIEYVESMGVVSGFSDGTYRPEGFVDRAQMAVFLARALVAPDGEEGLESYLPPLDATFTDVPSDHWAYLHVEFLADPSVRVIRGDPDGAYHPQQVCTREEMTALVARAFPQEPPQGKEKGEDHSGAGESAPKGG